MRLHILIFFFVSFWAGCSASSDNGLPVNEAKVSVEQNKTNQSNTNTIQEQEILSNDFRIAGNALEKAIRENDKQMLRTGLKNRNLLTKKLVVYQIFNMGVKEAIPDLIEELKHNQANAGDDARTLQSKRRLNEAVVTALRGLTKSNFDFSRRPAPKDTNRVIEESSKWWADYQKTKNPE